MALRLGVLASGSGSNLQALLDACAAGRIDGQVAVVVCNVPGAKAIARAEAAGVPVVVLPSKGVTDRPAYDRGVTDALCSRGVELVCLAGFMRILSGEFIAEWGFGPATRGLPRLMNIHPALLPSFPGLHGQRQALDHGAKLAGATVHFVEEGVDAGPVIIQAAVPVLPDDTEEALAGRILVQEHRIYPQAVQWFAQGRLALAERKVIVDRTPAPSAALVSPPLELE